MKVLIADDGLTVRRLLSLYLTEWGYEVVEAVNGAEAWEIIRKPDCPRLIILDWIMPLMDGPEICRKARALEHGKMLHIIIFTSITAKENLIAALQAGADDFLSKQFDMNELRARLQVGERGVSLKTELATRVRELEIALSHIKRLQGILPICMHCHRIRDEREAWQNLEKYLAENSDIVLSHGLCPDCLKKYYEKGEE